MPGRYGQPAGFGGGFSQPTRGEFQPGIEEGVIDPNIGRNYVCISTPSMSTHHAFSKPNNAAHALSTTPTTVAHAVFSKPRMNANCT